MVGRGTVFLLYFALITAMVTAASLRNGEDGYSGGFLHVVATIPSLFVLRLLENKKINTYMCRFLVKL